MLPDEVFTDNQKCFMRMYVILLVFHSFYAQRSEKVEGYEAVLWFVGWSDCSLNTEVFALFFIFFLILYIAAISACEGH